MKRKTTRKASAKAPVTPTIPANLKAQVIQWNKDVAVLRKKAEALQKERQDTPQFRKKLAELQKEKNRLEKAKKHIAMLASRRGLAVTNRT